MAKQQTDGHLEYAWRQQRIWSRTANYLKSRIDRGRSTALILGIGAAAAAITAVQVTGFSSPLGRALSLTAGVAAGFVPLMQRRFGTERLRDWTRARSASEGLKTEVYSYLAGGSAYRDDDSAQRLGENSRTIADAVDDLVIETLGIEPDDKPIPAVNGIESYVTHRVDDQINSYYRSKALEYRRRSVRLHQAGNILGGVAVVLGVAAATLGIEGLAAWVPLVTTVASSLAAHLAATRYHHLIIEFVRTAEQLQHLRDIRIDEQMGDAEFIDACESVISVENQAWMTRWLTTESRE